MTVDHGKDFFPEPFPDDLPTISLERICLAKLLDNDPREARRLFEVFVENGFCCLDLASHPKGMKLMEDAPAGPSSRQSSFQKHSDCREERIQDSTAAYWSP